MYEKYYETNHVRNTIAANCNMLFLPKDIQESDELPTMRRYAFNKHHDLVDFEICQIASNQKREQKNHWRPQAMLHDTTARRSLQSQAEEMRKDSVVNNKWRRRNQDWMGLILKCSEIKEKTKHLRSCKKQNGPSNH